METIFNFSGHHLPAAVLDDAMEIIDVHVSWDDQPDVAQVEAALTAQGFDVDEIREHSHIAIALPSWLLAAAAVARALPNAEVVQ